MSLPAAMQLDTKFILTGNEFNAEEINDMITLGIELKKDRLSCSTALSNKHLALVFEKPSLRTRLSFIVAMHELGGKVVESSVNTRKSELPKDLMQVIQGYCHAMMIRTYNDLVLEEMKAVSNIPIINGLTDLYHPCQILADLMTLKENNLSLNGLCITYIGDGNNILHSLLLMAPKLGINIHYCCPEDYGPNAMILKKAQSLIQPGNIKAFETPIEAAKHTQAIYTDVWSSMGFEKKDENIFADFQVNEDLMSYADPNALFMHCMPMERGKEVSTTLPDKSCSVIFQQSENRMHMQKALLYTLLSEV